MSNSKLTFVAPVISIAGIAGSYANALQTHPLIVKAITSAVMAATGNSIGQYIQMRGDSKDNRDRIFSLRSVLSYAIYGLLVGGPSGHFWLNFLEKHGPRGAALKVFIDRFIWGPVFLYATLYILSLLQGNTLQQTRKAIHKSFLTTFKGNLKIWLVCQYLNLRFVPLQYRTLISSLIALCWNIYLSGRTKRFSSSDEKPNTE